MAADDELVALLARHQVHVDVGGAGLDVDVGDHEPLGALERERVGPEELAGLAVVDEQAAGLAQHDHDLALFGGAGQLRIDPAHRLRVGIDHRVDERALLHEVLVPVVARQVLVVPVDGAGVGVHGDGRVGVQLARRAVAHVPGPAPDESRIGQRHCHAPEDAVQLGVEAAGDAPRRDVDPAGGGQRAPGLAAGIVGPGRGIGAPALGAAVRVVGRDVAARLQTRRAARAPADHVPLDDHGAGRVADPLPVVRRARFPVGLAGARVDGDDLRVGGQVIEVLAVQREVPRAVAELAVLADVVRLLPLVVPDQVAGGGVDRLQVVVARLGDVHHAVVDQRPDLLGPLFHRSHPGQPELPDVVAVDLIERAEGLEIVGAVRHQPVGGVRVAEHLVRDRHELLLLPGRGQLDLHAGVGRTASRQPQHRDDDAGTRRCQSLQHGVRSFPIRVQRTA